MLGGRCRIIVTGSAPLSQQEGEFMAIVFNIPTFEGWGMTETSASGAVQPNGTAIYGFIGRALESGTQLRIKSIPEMGYTVEDKRVVELCGRQQTVTCPRGELLIKGPAVFQGYWNDDKKTADSVIDGWFYTGDIAEFNPVTNQVTIKDRKRGIIKLSQGEYISINQIEECVCHSPLVEAVYLYANRYCPITGAVIVPNK